MRILIAEDEPMSREVIYEYLSPYGDCIMVENGKLAVEAFKKALETNQPFDLVCLDIMMPVMNGHQALKKIHAIEIKKKIALNDRTKVIMTTALGDQKNVMEAFLVGGAAKYVVKPIQEQKLLNEVRCLGLIK